MPFRALARKTAVSQERLLRLVRHYKRTGLVRRFGIVLAHRRVGLRDNALIAWNVPARRVVTVARRLSQASCVSHCYLRKSCAVWPYNLYTMVHAASRAHGLRLVRALSKTSGITDFTVLSTVRELKKTKMNLERILA